jgi:predicted glycogen debranching enzyme
MSDALQFQWDQSADASWLTNREWLVTNGLGGYASGSVLDIPTRRYHGLFVPNLESPKGRHVLIGRFDEEVVCGASSMLLGGAELADGTLQSDSATAIRGFRLDGLVPVWRFAVGAALLERTIVMPHGRNTVSVLYRLIEGPAIQMRLRPHTVFRRVDAPLRGVMQWPPHASADGEWCQFSLAASPLRMRCAVRGVGSAFVEEERVTATAFYRDERDRGYEHVETSFSPGYFLLELGAAPVSFIATTEEIPDAEPFGEEALAAERERCKRLLARASHASDALGRQLVLAADQFLILPGRRAVESRNESAAVEEPRTVIAGYHWFGDWGRDTMISFEGLTLCTGRYREAADILRTFSRYVCDGLLPNLFPEGEREARYNTMDATLWFFHAIDRYCRHTNDRSLLAELYPVLDSIIDHHLAGTHFGIGVDAADGLLRGGSPGFALTWMDAKFEDWVVTPRRGKPVEIQGLWYNALALMADWANELGYPSEQYCENAARVRNEFNRRFWSAERQSLLDVVDGLAGDDASLRPNQIITFSLQHPVLDEAAWGGVLACVGEQLLTPFGLRTLAASDPNYCRDYHGDLRTRDSAYHQGTVWPWLLGHYVNAWLRAGGSREEAHALLARFPAHLRDAGIGSISEIFDAEAPYRPRGCIAQAWSVAEILRAWLKTGPA